MHSRLVERRTGRLERRTSEPVRDAPKGSILLKILERAGGTAFQRKEWHTKETEWHSMKPFQHPAVLSILALWNGQTKRRTTNPEWRTTPLERCTKSLIAFSVPRYYLLNGWGF